MKGVVLVYNRRRVVRDRLRGVDIKYFNDNWSVLLFCGSALCYLIGYLKSYFLFFAIKLQAIPTDIYSPFNLFVSGLIFIISSSVAPLTIWACIRVTLLVYNNYSWLRFSEKIDKHFKKMFSLILGAACVMVLGVGTLIPIIPIVLITEFEVYFYIILAIPLVVLALGIYFFTSSTQKGTRHWLTLTVSIIFWVIIMFSGQIYAIKNIASGEAFCMTNLGQHPGITGNLILKDCIMGAEKSFIIPGAYQIHGILLNKSDKLYYFAVLPKTAIISSLYILPEEKVLGFEASTIFADFKSKM